MKILFRKSLAEENEFEVAKRYFEVVESRTDCCDDKIICRYSALPYYEELEKDVKNMGGTLVNSYAQHRYVANLAYWYHDLADLTPKTWFRVADAMTESEGPFILKGATNSRKHQWNTHMYAKDHAALTEVHGRLLDDSLIGSQNIIVREFEPFINYGEGINGLPITKEFRFFIYKGSYIAGGFYWASHPEVVERYNPDADEVPMNFLREVARRVSPFINFFVVDIAQHVDGRWRVVELNDGQMSGLSCIDPDKFYNSLAMATTYQKVKL